MCLPPLTCCCSSASQSHPSSDPLLLDSFCSPRSPSSHARLLSLQQSSDTRSVHLSNKEQRIANQVNHKSIPLCFGVPSLSLSLWKPEQKRGKERRSEYNDRWTRSIPSVSLSLPRRRTESVREEEIVLSPFQQKLHSVKRRKELWNQLLISYLSLDSSLYLSAMQSERDMCKDIW